MLVEVNVAGEDAKAGIAPADLPGFLERCPVRVVGLMGMPPVRGGPGGEPPALRRTQRGWPRSTGCTHLSMGTSQDYAVAVEEGATIVRVGSVLFE